MAVNQLFLYKIGGIGGVQMRVMYNDNTESIYVETSKVIPTQWKRADNEGQIPNVLKALVKNGVLSPYSFCQGSTKVTFESRTTFPYAQKVGIPGGCFDIEKPSNVELTLTAYDETLPGQSDGRIIATWTSYYAILKIELRYNGLLIATNTTGVFENLEPGVYTVFIQNIAGNGDLRQVTINAATLDTYGVYAQVNTGSIYLGYPILLQIRKRDYVGPVNEACFVGNDAINISVTGQESPYGFPLINGAALDFNLFAEGLRDWSILYTSDDREYLADVYLNSELIFRGYLLPEFIDAQFTEWNHTANFTASDGLGQLKEFPFTKANGDKYTGQYTLRKLLEICLGKVNLNLPLLSSINWTYIYSPSLNYNIDILGQLQVDAGLFYILFKECTCNDVVNTILTAFAARIAQVKGKFVLEQPFNNKTAAQIAFYKGVGTELLNRLSVSGQEITPPSAVNRVDNILRTDQTKQSTLKPAAAVITLTETLQPLQGLVKNSNLQNYDNFKNTDTFTRRVYVAYWALNGIPVRAFFNQTDTTITDVLPNSGQAPTVRTQFGGVDGQPFTGIVCDGIVFPTLKTTTTSIKPIETDLGIIRKEDPFYYTRDISLLAYFKITTRGVGYNIALRIKFIATVGDGTYYLSADGKQWQLGDAYRTYRIAKEDTGSDKEFSFTTPVLPYGFIEGNIRLQIFEPYAFIMSGSVEVPIGNLGIVGSSINGFNTLGSAVNPLAIKQVQVKPLYGGVELVSTQNFVFKNKGEYATKEAKVEMKLGSHYYGKNPTLFYPYALQQKSNNMAVGKWADEDGQLYTFPELAYRTLIRARQIPRETLEATLKGRFNFNERVQLIEDNNTEYFAVRWSFNLINDAHSVTLLYAVGFLPQAVIRIHEDGSRMLTEDGEILRQFEKNRTYDEDFTTI